ncbi:hypothetical protein SNE40_018691 [Patella caerulea]|uniref:Pyridine nucleotide-disulfide oxidoreductase domain-containing protein 1 n=1 Tax=Patella caerulea TaxID=87958 RepID=A0AAN8J6V6_PATCE
MNLKADFAIIGGGIGGVTCAETLSHLNPDTNIVLITASSLIKTVTNLVQVSERIESFDVEEKPKSYLESTLPNVQVVHAAVAILDSENHILKTSDGTSVGYKKVCICTGGRPKVIVEDNPFVLGIRDTESVQEFQKRLKNARRIIVIGNGGIATELVYEVEGCEVIWAIKDKSISSAFVDAGAAQFFLPCVNKEKTESRKPLKRHKYTEEGKDDVTRPKNVTGGALGPDWSVNRDMVGNQQGSHKVHIEYSVEMANIFKLDEIKTNGKKIENPSTFDQITDDWPVCVELTNGKIYGADFIVSATGVVPNSHQFSANNFEIAEDGGIKVNDKMETNVKDVFAAGDICTASWIPAPHWIQMRLWSQARQMGCYAAKSMVASLSNEDVTLDFCFELFTHMTKFFNYKVILLGKFNGQGLGEGQEILLRFTEGVEYVKAIIQDGHLQGAVLIGETDLEETFENLILNKIDLTLFKEHLLDPNIDIEDFFD